MAASQCPHCGSKYITFQKKTESFEKITESYYCQSCKKTFDVTQGKQSVDGTWLMTVYDNYYNGSYTKELKIYKTASGFMVNQKDDKEFKTRSVTPRVRINHNQYTHMYYLWFDTFRTAMDNDGMIITATIIEMNEELTEKALKSEAMRIIHQKGNRFCAGNGYDETTLLQDVCAWFGQNVNFATPSGGCYVATAVYGSYDCPQVWTLRRFRDYTLAESRLGRLFVRAYYAISPTLVKWFGHKAWFAKLWRPALDAMVNKLRKQGVEDTPYKDLPW